MVQDSALPFFQGTVACYSLIHLYQVEVLYISSIEFNTPLAMLSELFSTDGFPERWQCGVWSEAHGWVHILSDIAIWSAYMTIPFVLFYALKKRPETPNHVLIYLFIGFIMLCGLTHLLEALIFWWPAYRFLGLMKLATAVVSVATVVMLVRALPKVIQYPTIGAFEEEIERRADSERKLAESEDLFRTAMRYAPIGKALVSLEGKFMLVNHKLCELLGYAEEELLRQDFQHITHPEDLDADLDCLKRTLAGEINEYSIEKRYIRKDGQIVHAQLNVVLIRHDGEPQHFVSQILDISTRKRLMQRQEKLISELAQRNRDMQQIVYVASHDLRSPLVNIIGFSTELNASASELQDKLLKSDSLDELSRAILETDMPEMLQFINTNALRMDILLKGLLRYSRLGRYTFTIQQIDMDQMLAELLQGVSFQLKEVGAKVDVGLLPNCYGDKVLVGQLFTNLIDNAIKYRSPERTLVLKIMASTEGDYVRYTVSDNGQGIDPKYQERIFEVFHRLNPGEVDGDGLGLSLCSLIARRLEGDISIDSEFGVGSNFHVKLPRNQAIITERADAISNASSDHNLYSFK